jgi:hypothetical protein
MDRDPFLAAIEGVAEAGRSACVAIESAVSALEVGARSRSAGVPLVDIVDDLIGAGGREVRLAATHRFHEFEGAVAEMRASVVRILIEDEGESFTEVGRRLHISRQAVARLYRQGTAGERDAGVT